MGERGHGGVKHTYGGGGGGGGGLSDANLVTLPLPMSAWLVGWLVAVGTG